jgi:hypothetical protein
MGWALSGSKYPKTFWRVHQRMEMIRLPTLVSDQVLFMQGLDYGGHRQ